ncbi:MFS transporter [Ruegeria sp. EL01]|jgi:MFS family permease|uniref:MFS transporter n=1 Tax=Ruegeria sp. EL01 TaxID=2107578 RepID=UPI000EA806F2|nr:MFS transporter [Ruegeria sp. EL01]
MSKRDALWREQSWQAVVAAFIFNGLLFGAWASRVPAFKGEFELEPSVLGVLLLALAGGAIVSFPLAGGLSERWGADRLTFWCSWGYAPALALLALAPSALTLGVALFVFGGFHGAMDVAMNGWGAKVEERLGRSTMSIFHAMFSLGAGIGAASGYVAARLEITTIWHFALVTAFGSILAISVMNKATVVTSELRNPISKRPFFSLPSGSLLLVGLIAFSNSVGEGAMADWSAVFLRLTSDADEARAALGYAVFSIMMVLTRLIGGVVVERLGSVTTTRASAGITFVGLMIAIFGGSFATALFGFALMGIGYAVVMPLVFSRAAADPNVPAGPAIASVATFGYGGMLLGPPIIGFVAQLMGIRLSFLILAALAILAFALARRLKVT